MSVSNILLLVFPTLLVGGFIGVIWIKDLWCRIKTREERFRLEVMLAAAIQERDEYSDEYRLLTDRFFDHPDDVVGKPSGESIAEVDAWRDMVGTEDTLMDDYMNFSKSPEWQKMMNLNNRVKTLRNSLNNLHYL